MSFSSFELILVLPNSLDPYVKTSKYPDTEFNILSSPSFYITKAQSW